jgi:hypothetical protein
VLYNTKESKIKIRDDPTPIDNEILQWNAATLNHMLYGHLKMKGSPELYVIGMLYEFMNVKRVKQNEMLTRCLKETIQ